MFWRVVTNTMVILAIAVFVFLVNSCAGVAPERSGKAAVTGTTQPEPKPEEILSDPYDKSKSCSYWADAREGDWVRFLNWQKNLIVFKVLKHDGDIIKMEVKQFTREGKDITDKRPDIREVNVEEDDRLMRIPFTGAGRYIERRVFKWKLYGCDKTIYCEHHWIPNPMTKVNIETLYSRDVRCGGFVFQRRGDTSYVILVDYGDKEHPPKWDNLKPADLLKYGQKFDRFLHEKPDSNNDPSGEEQSEPPGK